MTAGMRVARAVAAIGFVLMALLGGTAASAAADPPSLTIAHPLAASFTNSQTPVLDGFTEDALDPVSVRIYSGWGAQGQALPGLGGPVLPIAGAWALSLEAPLEPGRYTAVAEQAGAEGEPLVSEPVMFTVDTTPPGVTLSPPGSPTADPTPTLSGSAGSEEGDLPTVTVQIHEGATLAGTVVRTAEVQAAAGSWADTVSPQLPDGTYTARVAQADEAGNLGTSGAVTFTIDTTAPAVTITTPAFGAVPDVSRPPISGHAGTASGDRSAVTLKIFAGTSTSGAPVQTVHLTASGGKWGTGPTGPSLPDGIYTAVAEQEDEAGNAGRGTTTFTVMTSSPTVTLTTHGLVQRGGRAFSGATPTFTGSAGTGAEDGATVAVRIFQGTSTSGSPLQSFEGAREGSSWSIGPIARLGDGTYTAQAEQSDSDLSGQPGVSESSTFTVDGDAPHVTLTSPAGGSSLVGSSQTLGGAAGAAEGDVGEVTVRLFQGTTTAGQVALRAASVPISGGSWSASFADLSPGAYTARVEQRDDVGNIGQGAPVSFTVTAPVPAAAASGPTAAFGWFPAAPRVGEAVSLVSTSIPSDSPLTTFAWAVGPQAAFVPAGPATVTTFTAPGAHAVRLRVLDAVGRASVATETIAVAPATAKLMQPFPIVRIAGSESASGARISLLTVQTPVGSTARVSCRGRGCPVRSQSVLARAGKRTARSGVMIGFRRFERSFGAGAVLQIRVSRDGQIGKYTRFTVRHGRLPVRLDTCLSPDAVKPMACPST